VVRIHAGVPLSQRKISRLAAIREDRTRERPFAKGRFSDNFDQQLTSAGMRFGLAPLLVAAGACALPVISGRAAGWRRQRARTSIGAQINAV
jgi:hypothetical protein